MVQPFRSSPSRAPSSHASVQPLRPSVPHPRRPVLPPSPPSVPLLQKARGGAGLRARGSVPSSDAGQRANGSGLSYELQRRRSCSSVRATRRGSIDGVGQGGEAAAGQVAVA
ncbi:hypothetical protein BRADI_3g40521v3 [Brachypodium distachyon]|uniref:Uncharacterized protein n=1 Tax=Brachypodium distachyon TaxID=15368 RepID=A0A2K2D2C2_BRADI|nr:hypothetical protein BRADI_3g40521v3 [Brachypodium distachyon]